MADETPTPEQITSSLEKLAELTSEELAQLTSDIRAAYEAHRTNDTGVVDTGLLTSLADGLDRVAERSAELAAEEAEALAAIAELDARVAGEAVELDPETAAAFEGVSDDDIAVIGQHTPEEWEAYAFLTADPDASVETEETVAEETPESEEVRAASVKTPAKPRTVRLPVAPSQPMPVVEEAEQILARDFATEAPMTETQVNRALERAVKSYGRVSDREIRVASIPLSDAAPRMDEGEDPQAFYDRQLDEKREWRKQQSSGGVRQASGELCAPPFVDYSVVNLGSDAQPIGSIFPRAAGGTADQMKTLRFFRAITFEDVTDVTLDTTWGTAGGTHANTVGVGSATATQNALATDNASSPYPKLAMRANCLTPIDCEQRANWIEIVWDNLGSMAWPEFVAAVRRAGDIALANQMDELRLQDWFDAADSAGALLTPTAQPYNANHQVLKQVIDIVQNDRSDKRDWDAPYVVAAPKWLDGALVSETLGTVAIASGDEAITEARGRIFREYGITFVGYLGRFGVTAAANLTAHGYPTKLPALADGAIPQAPCEARLGIARDDAGFERIGEELNLGVLRTETDLANNDFRTFYETWNRLCFRDAPIVADVTVNPSSAIAAAITPLDLCAGSGS